MQDALFALARQSVNPTYKSHYGFHDPMVDVSFLDPRVASVFASFLSPFDGVVR